MLKIDRGELAGFLRSRRERLRPEDIGLPGSSRRRTSGLRREEVAMLAGMSVDYYSRLEQARGPQPSAQVLTALSRALRLNRDEHDHLFHLSGLTPEPEHVPSSHVRPAVVHLLAKLDDTPAFVGNDRCDILAWNAMHAALLGDPGRLAPDERNVAWQHFCVPGSRDRFLPEEFENSSRAIVADLRATLARRPDDPRTRELTDRLRAGSPVFAELWGAHDVRIRRRDKKTILHPVVGRLDLDCEVLLSPDHDQRLVIHSAPAGSPSHAALALLRVVGAQEMRTETEF
jgi:transcriptional regulator with XRE-family HTH domain